MAHFPEIKEALEYIDRHLDEAMDLDSLAHRFHFSPFYFHRVFSAIVGKTVAAHIRDRRLTHACVRLSSGDRPVLEIALDSGYDSAQAFCRAFKAAYGLTPTEYRRHSYSPVVMTVEELIEKFTNRLKGGVVLNPNIIKRGELVIAGVSGDGGKTGEVWSRFEKLAGEKPLTSKLSDNGYEVRLYCGGACTVHVGFAVSDERVDPAYEVFRLPVGQYASFDVYVANGYDSENTAMDEWLATNVQGYAERLLRENHFCVEYYDERFKGGETGSIVEIWIPIEKK